VGRDSAIPTPLQDDCSHSPLAGLVWRVLIQQAIQPGTDDSRTALLVGQDVLCTRARGLQWHPKPCLSPQCWGLGQEPTYLHSGR
jgi:hypothetical protein